MKIVRKLYADGRVVEVHGRDVEMDLEAMQRFVGGDIQLGPCVLPRTQLVMAEDGLVRLLPPNAEASALDPYGRVLVGDILVARR